MITSMTGFARRASNLEWGELIWELRSLNHRGLDISVRTPDGMQALEPEVRRGVSERVTRGRIDASFMVHRTGGDGKIPEVNQEFVESLKRSAETISLIMPSAESLSVAEVLHWPGAFQKTGMNSEELREQAMSLLALALDDLVEQRRKEGGGLHEIFVGKIGDLDASVRRIEELIPDAEQEFRERIRQRIESLGVEVDSARLEQEIALILVKGDVREEIDRLRLHIQEFKRVLDEESDAGKRLSFLVQEMSREANTCGAKSSSYALNALAVDMKVAIEQIREQIHNVE